MDDMVAKSRQSRGSKAAHAKLNEETVIEIRRLYAEGTSQRALAKTFGVSQHTISKAARGIYWRHVKPDLSPRAAGEQIQHS